jgi:hypothetical protein
MQLLPAFAAAYTACYPLDKTWHGKVRQRKVGGGAKGLLAQMDAKLLFILVYQKTNPLQTMHGFHFGQQFPLTVGSSYTSDVGMCLAGSLNEPIC